MSDLSSLLTVVLATGDGKPLRPLAKRRTVAAINFGGSYRIIDFALANCLNSRLRRVYVMTQYNSFSLQNHLRDGWSIYKSDLGEFISPVTPPIRDRAISYSGAAHVLFHNLYLLQRDTSEHVLVCSGEHVYRMDYAALVEQHLATRADATLAGFRADGQIGNATEFRMQVDLDGCVTALTRTGESNGEMVDDWSSMGIMVVRRALLIELLEKAGETGSRDMQLEHLVTSWMLGRHRVLGYEFGGPTGRVSQDRYWRRMTTLDDYFEANMDLLQLEPPMDLYQKDWPIRTYHHQQPPARTVPGASSNEGICVNSIIASGTVIAGGGVNHSVLADGCLIDDAATVEDSILFPGVRVGPGARVQRAIIDRDVRVPAGFEIGFDPAADSERFAVTPGGVVVVPSGFDAWGGSQA